MDILDCLMKIGFTKHESILYITLCKEGGLTGYEASKHSGITRSNAYLALAGLVEKGGAFRIEEDAVKYTAVPVDELALNLKRQLDETLAYIKSNIPGREVPHDAFVTISGRENIINKMKNVINNASERIYISVTPAELCLIENELVKAREKGLKVVILTSKPFKMDGAVIYHNHKEPGQIRLIADTAHVLTGEINGAGSSNCLYSKNKNLVQLIKDSLTNEIKLIQLQVHE